MIDIKFKTMLQLKFKTNSIVIAMLICTSVFITDAIGQITIAKWSGNKEAALSIGSDDGMIRSIKSSWTLKNPDVPYDGYYKLGQDHHINITFFIDGRQIDDTTYAPFSSYIPITQPAASSGWWDDWNFMHNAGHEIASHTYSHANFKTGEIPSGSHVILEIVQNNTQIARHIGEAPVSFNMPFTAAHSSVWPIVRDYYPIVANDVWKQNGRHFDINRNTKQGEMEAMLRDVMKSGSWMTATGHGIRTELGHLEESSSGFIANGKRWDGYSPVDYNVLDDFFRFARSKEDSLFIGTFKDVGRYKMEYDSSTVSVISETTSELIINVVHNLNPSHIFIYPLTLKIPAYQYNIDYAVQGGVYLPVKFDRAYSYIDVIPNGGKTFIALKKNKQLQKFN